MRRSSVQALDQSTDSQLINHRILTVVALTAMLVCLWASAVGAVESRKPVVKEPIHEHEIQEIDPFVLDVCGIVVTSEITVRGHYVLYGDGTSRTHLNIEIVYSDPETGETLFVERDAETFFDTPISETIDEEAGTLTLVFESTITGLPLKGMVPSQGVVLRDAGRLTEIITVVIDLQTGEEISFDATLVEVRGPHPFYDLSPDQRNAILCGALGADADA